MPNRIKKPLQVIGHYVYGVKGLDKETRAALDTSIIRHLDKTGLSMSAIARQLSRQFQCIINKNMLIGMVHRLRRNGLYDGPTIVGMNYLTTERQRLRLRARVAPAVAVQVAARDQALHQPSDQCPQGSSQSVPQEPSSSQCNEC